MSRWFRHYAGLTADPKFGGIARRSKATKERVVFVWCCILESASEVNGGGVYTIDADSIADLLGCDTNEVQAILDQLTAAGMVAESKVQKWAVRQFESDTSASRTRRYRDKKRHGDGDVTSQNVTVTPCDGDVTPPETETETETETDKAPNPSKPETTTRGGDLASGSGGDGSKYEFEAGPIRLTPRDFKSWQIAFENLSLRSELLGLVGYAEREVGEGRKWFHAVQGALAKRNREVGLEAKRMTAEAIAKASQPKPIARAYVC